MDNEKLARTIATIKKKEITVVLEYESYDEYNLREDFIKNDLETEINCCSNGYEIKSIAIRDI